MIGNNHVRIAGQLVLANNLISHAAANSQPPQNKTTPAERKNVAPPFRQQREKDNKKKRCENGNYVVTKIEKSRSYERNDVS
jgi:hypothetical protein